MIERLQPTRQTFENDPGTSAERKKAVREKLKEVDLLGRVKAAHEEAKQKGRSLKQVGFGIGNTPYTKEMKRLERVKDVLKHDILPRLQGGEVPAEMSFEEAMNWIDSIAENHAAFRDPALETQDSAEGETYDTSALLDFSPKQKEKPRKFGEQIHEIPPLDVANDNLRVSAAEEESLNAADRDPINDTPAEEAERAEDGVINGSANVIDHDPNNDTLAEAVGRAEEAVAGGSLNTIDHDIYNDTAAEALEEQSAPTVEEQFHRFADLLQNAGPEETVEFNSPSEKVKKDLDAAVGRYFDAKELKAPPEYIQKINETAEDIFNDYVKSLAAEGKDAPDKQALIDEYERKFDKYVLSEAIQDAPVAQQNKTLFRAILGSLAFLGGMAAPSELGNTNSATAEAGEAGIPRATAEIPPPDLPSRTIADLEANPFAPGQLDYIPRPNIGHAGVEPADAEDVLRSLEKE